MVKMNETENPYAAKPWVKHYDKGVPEHIEYPEMNVYKLLVKQQFGS